MYELKLKLEIDEGVYSSAVIAEVTRAVIEEISQKLLIRVQVEVAPAGTLPRYDLKAKRFIKRK